MLPEYLKLHETFRSREVPGYHQFQQFGRAYPPGTPRRFRFSQRRRDSLP